MFGAWRLVLVLVFGGIENQSCYITGYMQSLIGLIPIPITCYVPEVEIPRGLQSLGSRHGDI